MGMRFDSGRTYTRDEVIRAMCEAMNLGERCFEQHRDSGDLSAPLWKLVEIPLSDLETMAKDGWHVERYAARRRRGEVPPPIVLDVYEPGRVHYPYDGNHRIAAARLAGDATIRAFVPA